MTKTEAIEREVETLNRQELASFREWFLEYDAEAWDREFEEDAAAGKLDRFASEAIAEFKSGETKEI
jgi:hypothetical protein